MILEYSRNSHLVFRKQSNRDPNIYCGHRIRLHHYGRTAAVLAAVLAFHPCYLGSNGPHKNGEMPGISSSLSRRIGLCWRIHDLAEEIGKHRAGCMQESGPMRAQSKNTAKSCIFCGFFMAGFDIKRNMYAHNALSTDANHLYNDLSRGIWLLCTQY